MFRLVAKCSHILTFIAGAAKTSVSVASKSVEARSLAKPDAILANRSAVAGTITIKSEFLDSSICPIWVSSSKSKRSE